MYMMLFGEIVDIQNHTILGQSLLGILYIGWQKIDSVLTQFPECSNYTNIFIPSQMFSGIIIPGTF